MASSRSVRSSPASHAAESLDGFMTRVNEMYDSMQEFIGTARQDRQEKGHYKAEFRQTRKRAHDLETELEKYQEQIFRSINPFQVSDTSISGELTSIQASLSNWIETLPDSERFVQNWPEVHKLLEDNGFVTHNSTLIPEVIGLAEAELLKTVAFGILWTILFKPSLLGSPSDICTFLDVVQANMPLLEPKKGKLDKSSKECIALLTSHYRYQIEQPSILGGRICSELGPDHPSMHVSPRPRADRQAIS